MATDADDAGFLSRWSRRKAQVRRGEAVEGDRDAVDTRVAGLRGWAHGDALVARQKDLIDDATPSANSMAALSLQRLAALTGEARFVHHADQILRLQASIATQSPAACSLALAAVHLRVERARERPAGQPQLAQHERGDLAQREGLPARLHHRAAVVARGQLERGPDEPADRRGGVWGLW